MKVLTHLTPSDIDFKFWELSRYFIVYKLRTMGGCLVKEIPNKQTGITMEGKKDQKTSEKDKML